MGASLPGFDLTSSTPYGTVPLTQQTPVTTPAAAPSNLEDMLMLSSLMKSQEEKKHHKVWKWVLGIGAAIVALTLAFLTGKSHAKIFGS